jgi:hypothetical protein
MASMMMTEPTKKERSLLIQFTPTHFSKVPEMPLMLIKTSAGSYFCVTKRDAQGCFSMPCNVVVVVEEEEQWDHLCDYAKRSFESMSKDFWESFGEGLFVFQIMIGRTTWAKLCTYPVEMVQEKQQQQQISFWKK